VCRRSRGTGLAGASAPLRWNLLRSATVLREAPSHVLGALPDIASADPAKVAGAHRRPKERSDAPTHPAWPLCRRAYSSGSTTRSPCRPNPHRRCGSDSDTPAVHHRLHRPRIAPRSPTAIRQPATDPGHHGRRPPGALADASRATRSSSKRRCQRVPGNPVSRRHLDHGATGPSPLSAARVNTCTGFHSG
jgi:hypothetical protein